MKPLRSPQALVLLTFCCVLFSNSIHANSATQRSATPSLSEQIQALATQSLAIRDAHAAALHVLERSQDFQLGVRALRHDLTQLSQRLPLDSQLSSLGHQARQLAAQLAKQLPTGAVTPEDANRLDHDALTTARQAETLRHDLSAIRAEITGTLEQVQKWENTYYAFDFDPRRQNQIVGALIADRRKTLTEQPAQPRIEPDPELPTAIASSVPAKSSEVPFDLALSTPIPQAVSPPAPDEPIPELRAAVVVEDPLLAALSQAQADPSNALFRHHLNHECFKHLAEVGPLVLQPESQVRLSESTMAHLQEAARLKVPAALHLLGLMHLTGQGSGLNYPRGTTYIKQAALLLDTNPQEPFGPGIDADDAAQTLSQVGTSWFWLAETYLLGLMEQQPEKAAALYRTAAQYGDPRAQQRIRQLTAVDRSRVFITWPPSNSDPAQASTILGLVEHCGTDLDELETKLAAKTELTQAKPATKSPQKVAVEQDILRPFLGIDFTQDYPMRGVSVRHVLISSPADLAGLRPGDLIIQVNDRSTSTLEAFTRSVGQARPGDTLKLRVLRAESQPFETHVKLGTITALNDDIEAVLEPLRLPTTWNPHQVGFRIISVRPNSPAARSGLRPGDIVLGANDRHLRQWNDLAAALHNRHGLTTLLIQRRLPGGPPQLLSAVISTH